MTQEAVLMGLSERLKDVERDDFRASLRFVALVLILLVLPNQELDMLLGLNPLRVWLVVVFIAGLSFLGYLLSKVVEPATAIGVTGVLGGCVSPGLTISSLSEQARRYPEFSAVYAFAAAAAVTMLFPRNFVVIGIVNPSLALSLIVPFTGMAAVAITVSSLLWLQNRTRAPTIAELDTPFRIRSALVFGGIIAAIIAVLNTFELSLPSDATQIGIVLITIMEMSSYVGLAWTVRLREMTKVLAVILFGSGSFGVAIVLFL